MKQVIEEAGSVILIGVSLTFLIRLLNYFLFEGGALYNLVDARIKQL